MGFEERKRMLLLIWSVALLPLLTTCYPTTDTTSSEAALECSEDKLETLRQYWIDEIEQLYTWLDRHADSGISGPVIHEQEQLTEKGCSQYDANKHEEKYGCFPKHFFCAAKKVVENTDTAYTRVRNHAYAVKSWRRHFAVPAGYQDGVWGTPVTDDIKWAAKIRWDDPKLMFLRKADEQDQSTQNMLERMYHYLETNNVDEVANIFHCYQVLGVEEAMNEQCEDMDSKPMTLPCKIAIVFDGIAPLIRDNEAIGWDGSSAPPRTREELAILYLLQPQLYDIMEMSSEAHQNTLKYRLQTMFQAFYDNTHGKRSEEFRDHFGKFGNIYSVLARDCNETYHYNISELPCYLSETFKRLNELKISLGPNFDDWTSAESESRNVVVTLWLLLTPKAGEYFTPSDNDLTNTLKNLLHIFYRKIQEKGLASVRYIIRMLPPKHEIGLDSTAVCKPNFDQLSRDVKCGYTIMLENIVMFLDEFESKGGKLVKKLDMSVDYRYRLEQFKISSIHGAVINTKLELQSSLHEFSREIKSYFEASIGNRFKHLRDYFTTVASYDEEIADADVAFITTKLNEFYTTAYHIHRQLELDATMLQNDVMVATGLDAIFMWVKAVARCALGIFGAISGDFGGMVDAMDAVDEAMQATLNVVEAVQVKKQIEIATQTYREIDRNLAHNRQQLETSRKVIEKLGAKQYTDSEFMRLRDDFIKSYNDYTPMVTEAQLAKLDTAWSTVIDNLDDLLSSVQTTPGVAVAIVNYASNHVFKVQILVPQLEATLSARFEYQFDLMDSLAATLRAHNSMQAARSLSKGFKDLEQVQDKSVEIEYALEHMALSTYIISQFHILLALTQYCQYITYTNIGIQPIACKKALATLNNAHIDEALSYQPPPCDILDVNLRIPTSETGELKHLNLRHLNSGTKVLFQIPNFDWLKRNADLSPEDEKSGLYVKMFEIYALTNSTLDHPLRVEVSASGPAFVSNITDHFKYELRPRSRARFVFEYKETYGNCKEEQNPYHVCSPGPKKICVQNRGELENKMDLYPSIYTPWIIQLNKKIGNVPKPQNTTILFLQAKLKLCKRTKDSENLDDDASGSGLVSGSGFGSGGGEMKQRKWLFASKKRRVVRSLSESDSPPCPENKYFDQISRQFETCSEGTTPQHHGYYCGHE